MTPSPRGDWRHDQLNTRHSIRAYPPANPGSPLRVLAQGRDASASGDGAEDNRPTGVHVSNDGLVKGIASGTPGNPSDARGFFRQQHGDNTDYERTHN